MNKVIKINSESIVFDNEYILASKHHEDCCEEHYLDFSNLNISDFEGLEFDLSNDNFFTPIEDFGIHLNPVNGHSIPIPGYGSNNGFYSENLYLVLYDSKFKEIKSWDIEKCQKVTG